MEQKETGDATVTKVQAKFHLTPAAHRRIKEVALAEGKTASQLMEEVALSLEPVID